MKKTIYYIAKISSQIIWDERTKILTHITFDSSEKEEVRTVVEGCTTYEEAKAILNK